MQKKIQHKIRNLVLFQKRRAGTIAKAFITHKKTEVRGFLISGL